MSIVDEAFAAISPEQWAASGSIVVDTVRMRVQRGACARIGCPRAAERRPRHRLLCAACIAAGWDYCPRCEQVAQERRRGPWCRACNAERCRIARGFASREAGRARIVAAAAEGGRIVAARADARNAEIARLIGERGWTVREVARALGLTENAVCARWRRYQKRHNR